MNHHLMRLALLIPWLGTWLLYREHKRALARMKRLLDDLNNIGLQRMEVRDSEVLMTLTKDALGPRIWAGIWQETIDSIGAPNFLEFKFGRAVDADTWLVVTVQRVPGKTPADKLRDAEARVAALESQRDALVLTLDDLYATETARCEEPTRA